MLRLSYVRSMSDHDGHSIVSLAVSSTSGDIISASHQGWSSACLSYNPKSSSDAKCLAEASCRCNRLPEGSVLH